MDPEFERGRHLVRPHRLVRPQRALLRLPVGRQPVCVDGGMGEGLMYVGLGGDYQGLRLLHRCVGFTGQYTRYI